MEEIITIILNFFNLEFDKIPFTLPFTLKMWHIFLVIGVLAILTIIISIALKPKKVKKDTGVKDEIAKKAEVIVEDVQTSLRIISKKETPAKPLQFPALDNILDPVVYMQPLDSEIPQELQKTENLEETKEVVEEPAQVEEAPSEEVQEEAVEEPTPVEEAPAEEVEEEVVEEPSPVEEAPAEEVEEEVVEEPTPVEEAPAEEVQEEVAEEPSPVEEAPAEEVKEEVVEEPTPVDETPSEEVKEEVVEEPTKVDETPAEEIKEEVVEEPTPVEEAPAEEVKEVAQEPAPVLTAATIAPKTTKSKAKQPFKDNTKEELTVISAATAKKKTTKVAKASAAKKAGGAVAIQQTKAAVKAEKIAAQKEKLATAKKPVAKKPITKAKPVDEMKGITLLNDAVKPDVSKGKFVIGVDTTNIVRPYKFILKANNGKVLFESEGYKVKPKATQIYKFKRTIAEGTFTYDQSGRTFQFRIIDKEGKLYAVVGGFKTLKSAQESAALIKRFGLAANFIEDPSERL